MVRCLSLILLFFTSQGRSGILFNDLLESIPKKEKLIYSGNKYLVGKLVIEMDVRRETKNHMQIHFHEKVYVFGMEVHRSVVDTNLSLRDFKPSRITYWDFRKEKMRFNFFFDKYYRYIRITDFQGPITIDAVGKILTPANFNPEKHEIKKSKHDFSNESTMVFDINLILLAIPHVDAAIEKKMRNMKLLFVTMDHVIPFILKITKEDSDYRYIELSYQHRKADEMQLLFDRIIVDKKKGLIKKITGSEKHVGSVYIELIKVQILEN